jgi:hypothetical protein
MLLRMMMRLWESIALAVKKRMVPKRTEKASLLKAELIGIPPSPV